MRSPAVADHAANADRAVLVALVVDPADPELRLVHLAQFLQRLLPPAARQGEDSEETRHPYPLCPQARRRPPCCLASTCTCSTEKPRIQPPFLPLLPQAADSVGSVRPVELLLLLLPAAVDGVSNKRTSHRGAVQEV